MIPLERAREIALSLVAPLGTEVLPLPQARGRFLARPLQATRPLPPFDSAAMDGWALRAEETAGATRDRPARLRVRAVSAAGAPAGPPLGPGEAVRIFTGAVVPAGADAVLRQEAGAEEGEELRAFAAARVGEHVRRAGEEVAVGEVALAAPCPLDAYALGVAASLGLAEVEVARAPRVAVVTVGDELVPMGSSALPYQIHDSNGALLAALAAELNAIPVLPVRGAAEASAVLHTHAPDEDARIRAVLEEALEAADLVVTCGGASVGDRDRVKPVLRAMGGELRVDGVLLKPGKPLGVAVARGKPVVVLPGNPGAAAVGFDQVARPMLLRMQGVAEIRRRIPVRLDAPRKKQAGLEYYLGAQVELDGTWPPLARIRAQGAGQLVHAVGAHGWVILPRGRAEFTAGEEHPMELFAAPRWT
ncbi:MAG TPA: gephyrin-like molybdotransferase Glp [Myxococcaceae bacterium]|jgi:molybdopterin molybdotransferase